MTKLNLLLVLFLVMCALGIVTAQHKARKIFIELQQEQELAKKMEVEWGQLQLEQSTWAMHTRIEKIATAYLQMQVPDACLVRLAADAAERRIGHVRHGRERDDGAGERLPVDHASILLPPCSTSSLKISLISLNSASPFFRILGLRSGLDMMLRLSIP